MPNRSLQIGLRYSLRAISCPVGHVFFFRDHGVCDLCVVKASWTYIPVELLDRVKQLSVQCVGDAQTMLRDCRLVNHHWSTWATTAVTFLQPTGRSVRFVSQKLKTVFSSVTSLKLDGCSDFDEIGVLRDVACVTRLDLMKCGSFAGQPGRSLGLITQLKHLDLTCCSMDDESLRAISPLTSLTFLSLERCHGVTDNGLKGVASLEELQYLTLRGWSRELYNRRERMGVGDVGIGGLTTLSNIQHLDLCGCVSVTNAGLRSVGALYSLQELILKNCYMLADDGFCEVTRLTRLRLLNATKCVRITQEGLGKLSTSLRHLDLTDCISVANVGFISGLTLLTYLDLKGLVKMSDEGLSGLHTLTSLEYLRLSQCCRVSDGGVSGLSMLTSLKHLDLRDCHSITNLHLEGPLPRPQTLARRRRPLSALTSLTHLSLHACSRLSDGGVAEFAQCTSLTYLDLGYCTSLSNESLRAVGGMSLLKSLNLVGCSCIYGDGFRELMTVTGLRELTLGRSLKLDDPVVHFLAAQTAMERLNFR